MKLSYYILLPLAFLLACTPPGEKKQAPQTAQLLQTAENLRQSGDTAGAVRVLREADAGQPNDSLILSQLGYALIANGQPQEAIGVFDRLIALGASNAGAYNGKAVALDRTGNHPAAQELYRQALKLSPDSLNIKNNLAMSLILSDQPGEAISLLESLNYQATSNQTVRQNLALAYALGGDKEKALAINQQDLPPAEAEENMRFYEHYISEHKKPAPAPAALSAFPATPAPQQKTAAATPSLTDILLQPKDAPAAPAQTTPANKLENLAPTANAQTPAGPADNKPIAGIPAGTLIPFQVAPAPNNASSAPGGQ